MVALCEVEPDGQHGVRGDGLQYIALSAPSEEERNGGGITGRLGCDLFELNDAIRLGIGERPQKNRVDDGEDR